MPPEMPTKVSLPSHTCLLLKWTFPPFMKYSLLPIKCQVRSLTVHLLFVCVLSLNLSASSGGGGIPQRPPVPPPSCSSVTGVGAPSFWSSSKEVLSLMGAARTGPLPGLWKSKGGEVEGAGGGEVARGLVR